MADTLLRRAAKEIESRNTSLKRVREQKKRTRQDLIGSVSTLGGAAAAAYVDSNWSEDGEPAKVKGIPTNAAVGVGLVAAAMVGGRKLPGAGAVGAAGLGMLSAVTYRMLLDKLDEDEAEG